MKITGIPQIEANLKKIGKKTENVIIGAVEAGSVEISNEAKKIVPVQTGNLQKSIGPENVKVENDIIEGGVHAGMEYAINVETQHHGLPGHPFLWPAVMIKANKAQELAVRALKIMGF